MEEVTTEDAGVEEDAKAFPCLKTLSIRDLPELTSICHRPMAFPALERIAVIDCPKLKKLPLKVSGGNALSLSYIQESGYSNTYNASFKLISNTMRRQSKILKTHIRGATHISKGISTCVIVELQ
ncbi:hypothetical protein RJ639_006359 [Escallonia herrerae]|uniref:Disease resistance protein n=1 Tax=Escallonia herrerae TaxID=1293975 RepID=A0AA88W470_9ASTE|nr:hypothetical protein RJ639_006359 [Escallonia herrerae]